jgi:hypothetical protein
LALLILATVAAGLLGAAPTASAQWTRVTELPANVVYSLRCNGDTIAAGTGTAVYVSTNSGSTWHRSAALAPGVTSIQAEWVRNGQLFAGTFGQGVYVSGDLGATWQSFNQGLVGGILDSQLFISDLQVRGDSLYAATEGAGVYVRNLANLDTWHHFGEIFEPFQASNVNDLALGGIRLLASGGGNGSVFYRDPGDPEWSPSSFSGLGMSQSGIWTGTGWVIGTSRGVYRSPDAREPWSHPSTGLSSVGQSTFALVGERLFAVFDVPDSAVVDTSNDGGATWARMESLPFVFVYQLAACGGELYTGRADGLWRRSAPIVSVDEPGGPGRLRFSLVGSQPAHGVVRFRFELPEAGAASIEFFDVRGRRAAAPLTGSWSAGPQEVSFDSARLRPGVYAARLSSAGRHEVVRLVRVP